MFTTIIHFLNQLSQNRWYWLLLLAASSFALGDALYYQHVLDEQPCVMCIQVRLWISLLIITLILGLLARNNRVLRNISNLSVVLIAVGLVERSYMLLGTERGFVFADCGFSLGLPAWFAIEDWLPWLYRIETSCGYTPELVFGITMAEALMVTSVLLLVLGLSVFLAGLLKLPDTAD